MEIKLHFKLAPIKMRRVEGEDDLCTYAFEDLVQVLLMPHLCHVLLGDDVFFISSFLSRLPIRGCIS